MTIAKSFVDSSWVFQVCANSQQEKDIWLDLLKKNITKARKAKETLLLGLPSTPPAATAAAAASGQTVRAQSLNSTTMHAAAPVRSHSMTLTGVADAVSASPAIRDDGLTAIP